MASVCGVDREQWHLYVALIVNNAVVSVTWYLCVALIVNIAVVSVFWHLLVSLIVGSDICVWR